MNKLTTILAEQSITQLNDVMTQAGEDASILGNFPVTGYKFTPIAS
jgi:hypothetical protein